MRPPVRALAFLLVAAAAATAVLWPRGGAHPVAQPPGYVGVAHCARCHAEQHALWTGSHHDAAMQEPTEATVLGDFRDAEATFQGVTSTFSRRDGHYFIRTDGPDGQLADYQVKYTFGVEPLQQYLIELPGGRLQALSLCWDTRPAEAGGQRWFHLYPDERIDHRDPLHWTGPAQNWNHMCAHCHSTGVRTNYDLAKDSFHTTWDEIDVGCEACHGPGSRHVEWAEEGGAAADTDLGLLVTLKERRVWAFAEGATIAHREPDTWTGKQLDSCAPCHSRRSLIAEGAQHGTPYLDSYLPALLDRELYHADGQIQDEVYVYGSFLQSRMHQQGVTCSDCHDPHSLRGRLPGNALCAQCHLPSAYDTPLHHHHASGTAGSQCVDCHMPSRRYMVVDDRRDHSFRVPRPDLTVSLGVPNACNGCHGDRPAGWAADAVRLWVAARGGAEPRPHFAAALHRGRSGAPGWQRALQELALDDTQPAIARATALGLLGERGFAVQRGLLARAVADRQPLVRIAAGRALEGVPAADRAGLGMPLLGDPLRAVRCAAVPAMAPARSLLAPDSQPDAAVSAEQQVLDAALQDYVASQTANADRPWAHTNLALLFQALGQETRAEEAYGHALRLDPTDVAARSNFADFLSERGEDGRGEALLREGLAVTADSPELCHSLGLLLVRLGRMPEAAELLRRAADGRPENPRFAYVHAVALAEGGEVGAAIEILSRAMRRHPWDRDLLQGLVSYCHAAGDLRSALAHAEQLAAASGDPEDARQVEELRRALR